MEYTKTKYILHVKRLLVHRKLENAEIYTHLINFEVVNGMYHMLKTWTRKTNL